MRSHAVITVPHRRFLFEFPTDDLDASWFELDAQIGLDTFVEACLDLMLYGDYRAMDAVKELVRERRYEEEEDAYWLQRDIDKINLSLEHHLRLLTRFYGNHIRETMTLRGRTMEVLECGVNLPARTLMIRAARHR